MTSSLSISNTIIKDILEENKWREKDFSNLKKIMYEKSNNDTILRMSIPLIYAHWEGYIVSIFKKIVCFLNNSNMHPNSVKDRILALSCSKIYPSTADKKHVTQIEETICNVRSILNNSVIKIDKKYIDTKSNLNFEQFEELCFRFCLDISILTENQNSFQSNINILVHKRNAIAHGEQPSISYKNANVFMDTVNDLIPLFIIAVDNYINDEQYKV